jgi:hypothetical protein
MPSHVIVVNAREGRCWAGALPLLSALAGLRRGAMWKRLACCALDPDRLLFDWCQRDLDGLGHRADPSRADALSPRRRQVHQDQWRGPSPWMRRLGMFARPRRLWGVPGARSDGVEPGRLLLSQAALGRRLKGAGGDCFSLTPPPSAASFRCWLIRPWFKRALRGARTGDPVQAVVG